MYERGLYKAFVERNPDNWLTTHYRVVDECRFQSPIPYRDQTVYAAVEDGRIAAAGAINFNTHNVLQLEMIGFEIDKVSAPVCEGLLLFSDGSLPGERFLSVASTLFEFIETDLIRRGMSRVYGTCSRGLKAMYTLLGFEVVDRLKLDGELKLLLMYEFG